MRDKAETKTLVIPRPLKLIYVEWDDAESRSAWMTSEELDVYRRASHIVRQSGFLIEQTDKQLVIAGSFTDETDWHHELCGDVTRIPRTWIRRQRTLGTVVDGELVPPRRRAPKEQP